MKIIDMSHVDCKALLARNHLGRLACSCDNRPYVVPITYASDAGGLYSFSMPGKKVDWMRKNAFVSMVVEERGQGEGRDWRSVVVYGRFEELPDEVGTKHSREHAWQLLSKQPNWWEPGGLKPQQILLADRSPHLFFRIAIDEMSGRQAIQ